MKKRIRKRCRNGKFEIEITEEHEGSRIDKALTTINPDWSRTQIQQWLKDGLVLVDGTQVKPNYKVKTR